MRIGVLAVSTGSLDELVGEARRAREEGFATLWSSQIFGLDALTALAVAGREVPDIELGTAVVPTYPRHPIVLAGQALTTQAAVGGRLALGIGLSHKVVIEGMFGYPFDRPARHMKEYLSALVPLLRGEFAQVTGETVTARGQVNVPGTPPPPVLLAALAPRMLRLAGAVGDGTITWMTGPATVESHIVPLISAAAKEAGKPTRVVVGLPVCVTADPEGAKQDAAGLFAVYGGLPSYRAMLDREGAAGPADVALVGDEETVSRQIRQVAEAGATDFAAAMFGNDADRDRTRSLLASIAR